MSKLRHRGSTGGGQQDLQDILLVPDSADSTGIPCVLPKPKLYCCRSPAVAWQDFFCSQLVAEALKVLGVIPRGMSERLQLHLISYMLTSAPKLDFKSILPRAPVRVLFRSRVVHFAVLAVHSPYLAAGRSEGLSRVLAVLIFSQAPCLQEMC